VLTISGGFSSGGSPAGRTYYVVDYSAYTGAHVVKVEYLDYTYAQKTDIKVSGIATFTGVGQVALRGWLE
jgi:hypothetical protein